MTTEERRLVPALFDGGRLRQARTFRGLRKAEVARAIGVTPAAVGQYESERTRPSAHVLASLALSLGFPPEFFERRTVVRRIEESEAHFRKLRSTSKAERDRLLVGLEFLTELVEDLERHVELPVVDIPDLPVMDDADETAPEVAAAEARRVWGLGPGPLDHVVRLLEAKGVMVVRPHVDNKGVDAFSTAAAGRPIVVLGSDKADAARSRFDAAHELGHLVMHQDAEPGRHLIERQAHRFAGAFLMPAETIRAELPTRMSWPAFFRLKQRWRVSLQALLYRARTLGTLSPDAYQRAQIYLSAQGWREHEPIDIGAPEQPTLLRRALELVQQDLQITKGSMASVARLPEDVVESLLADVGVHDGERPRVEVG